MKQQHSDKASSSQKQANRSGWLKPNPLTLTANELAWIEFIRLIGGGRDPAPTLRRVQLLRRVCKR